MTAIHVVRVTLRARDAATVGGFTGTIVESAVLRALGGHLHGEPHKPFSVTPLFLGGRPIVDRAALAPGQAVWFRAAFTDPRQAQAFTMWVAQRAELLGGRLRPDEVEYVEVDLDRVPLPDTRCFRVRYLTPTRYAQQPLMRRSRPLYDFTPRPINLFKSVIRHARHLGMTRLGAPFLRWVYTYVALTDFGCRGKCVTTVRLPNGGIARGYVGWATYMAQNRKRIRSMWKTLETARHLNASTGRSMGLGVVDITPLTCPDEKRSL